MVVKKSVKSKPWNKRRFKQSILTTLLFGAFLPSMSALAAEQVEPLTPTEVASADETVVDPETNETTASFLMLVDTFTTAERIPTERLNTPANVHVITAGEIEANHYQSVEEALDHVNGVFAFRSNNKSDGNQIYLGASQRVLVLVDGRRTNFMLRSEVLTALRLLKAAARLSTVLMLSAAWSTSSLRKVNVMRRRWISTPAHGTRIITR